MFIALLARRVVIAEEIEHQVLHEGEEDDDSAAYDEALGTIRPGQSSRRSSIASEAGGTTKRRRKKRKPKATSDDDGEGDAVSEAEGKEEGDKKQLSPKRSARAKKSPVRKLSPKKSGRAQAAVGEQKPVIPNLKMDVVTSKRGIVASQSEAKEAKAGTVPGKPAQKPPAKPRAGGDGSGSDSDGGSVVKNVSTNNLFK